MDSMKMEKYERQIILIKKNLNKNECTAEWNFSYRYRSIFVKGSVSNAKKIHEKASH